MDPSASRSSALVTDMTQSVRIATELPSELLDLLDSTANRTRRSRDQIIREAVESYLEDLDHLMATIENVREPDATLLTWKEEKRDVPGSNRTESKESTGSAA